MEQNCKTEKILRKWIFILLKTIFVLMFICAAFQFYIILQDYQRAAREYKQLAEQIIVIEETRENQNLETNISEETESLAEFPYNYEIPQFSIDLEAIKKRNQDTVGWIILPDSKINYPIVKSKDNQEYLETTFEGKKSKSGAIFVEMYCEADFSSQNTIVYGHNMKDGSMFRALNDMTNQEYFKKHHIFCIDMGNGFENYEVIACYETTSNDRTSWQIQFANEDEYAKWLEKITKRCTYDCVNYDINKNTITLSTCRGKSNGNRRFIVHLQKQN